MHLTHRSLINDGKCSITFVKDIDDHSIVAHFTGCSEGSCGMFIVITC